MKVRVFRNTPCCPAHAKRWASNRLVHKGTSQRLLWAGPLFILITPKQRRSNA